MDDLDGYAASSAQQQQPRPAAPPVQMPAEVHLPKIRVVVRKRPLNHKVCDAWMPAQPMQAVHKRAQKQSLHAP